MVNYFTAKPYNGDNPYHKELWESALVALFHFVLQLLKLSIAGSNEAAPEFLLLPSKWCTLEQRVSLLQNSYKQVCSG